MEGQEGGRESLGSGDKTKKKRLYKSRMWLHDNGGVTLRYQTRTKARCHHHNIESNPNLIRRLSER